MDALPQSEDQKAHGDTVSAKKPQPNVTLTAPGAALHSPLSSERREIRLLEIVSASTEQIVCNLSVVSLDESPRFSAISYVWGDQTDTELIAVNRHVVPVTKTLALALRHVQKHWKDVYPDRDLSSFKLWADALCINQKDLSERNQQCGQMTDIYRAAELVLASLKHPEPEVIAIAMETAHIIAALGQALSKTESMLPLVQLLFPFLISDDEDLPGQKGSLTAIRNKKWKAMVEMMQLPNWSRVWIFQEHALAARLVLFCESYSLPHEVFSKAIERIMCEDQLLTKQTSLFYSTGWPPGIRLALDRNDAPGARMHYMFSTIKRIGNRSSSGRRWGDQNFNNFIFLAKFADRLAATDPRDYIYGLMGVLSMDIKPDYSKSLSEVYEDFVSVVLKSDSASLFFLDYAGTYRSLPISGPRVVSWAPRLDTNIQPVTVPSPPGVRWTADLGLSSGRDAYVAGHCLLVEGLQASCVSLVESTEIFLGLVNGSLLGYIRAFLDHHPVYDVMGIPGLQALLRLLLMGAEFENFDTTAQKVLAFVALLEGMGIMPGDAFEPLSTLQSYPLPPHTDEAAFERAIRDVFFGTFSTEMRSRPLPPFPSIHDAFRLIANDMVLIHTRRLAEARGPLGSHIALVPSCAKDGDSIYILKGYSVPVLLQKEDDHWLYGGPCFVLGLMHGEGKRLVDEGLREVEQLEIH